MLYRVQESLDTEQMGEILYVLYRTQTMPTCPFLKFLLLIV
jgi:hypothetical protein